MNEHTIFPVADERVEVIDFPANEWGEGIDENNTDRILRVFRSRDGLTVVDAMAPGAWHPKTVFLAGIGTKAESIFPLGDPNWSNELILSNLLADVESRYDEDFDADVYPDGIFVVRVDFDLSDRLIETARDVTEDLGVLTDSNAYDNRRELARRSAI